MCRAVRNAAIDQARSTSRRRQREQIVARARQEEFESTPDALIDAKSAEAALKSLPPELREVVILRIWGGMGFVQIAQVMHAGVSTVHSRYVTALERMRQTLERSHAT
jgi:RNA polymerase sigma-70 factor (ECF subfamily)